MIKLNNKILLIVVFSMIFSIIPFTSIVCYAEQGDIYEVSATSNIDDFVPVINKTTTIPKITVTTNNVQLNPNACYWQKQKGGKWSYYSKNVFDEGTYRYHYSFFIPENVGKFAKYVLTSLDEYTISMESTYEAGKGYYLSGFSKEYVAQTSVLASHEVVFDSKGGTPISTKYIEHGQRILSHGTPYKEGFNFDGWYWSYVDENSGKVIEEKFDFSSPIENDITLFAVWIDKNDASRLEDVDSDYNDLMLKNSKYQNGYYAILDKVDEQCDVYITVDGETMSIKDYYANGGESIELTDPRLSYDKYVDGEIELFSYLNGNIKSIENNAQIKLSFMDSNGNIHGTSTLIKKYGDTYYFKIKDDELCRGVQYKIVVDIIGSVTKRIEASYFVTFSHAEVTQYCFNKSGTGRDIEINITKDSTVFSFSSRKAILGDADGNGVVDANDASIVLELYKSNINYPYYWSFCDLDSNQVIDANDASLILELYKTNN